MCKKSRFGCRAAVASKTAKIDGLLVFAAMCAMLMEDLDARAYRKTSGETFADD